MDAGCHLEMDVNSSYLVLGLGLGILDLRALNVNCLVPL